MSAKRGNPTIIYIHDQKIMGKLLQYGAYASIVCYEINGIEYETTILNDDFTIIREIDLGI